ncbi:hypothetical protein IP84_10125 [beta proteobacterium AAP99]|nr:hypothetical protein IP84_10125 [beta proteobacterium AAP99]
MPHRTQPLNRPLRLSDPAAPWWLPGGHAQTIWPALFSPAPTLALRRERWEWNDGDFVDADWVQPEPREAWAPVLVIFHGLEGSSKSHYARAIAHAATRAGLRVVIVHFRGCSGEPNRLARAYHSGDADEIERVAQRLHASYPVASLYACGISLGGSALANYVALRGNACLFSAAVAACAPLDLAAGGAAISQGFSMVYTRMFLRTMKRKAMEKLARFPGLFDAAKMQVARDLYDFDNLFTAPVHGYRNTEDYWARASAKPHLRGATKPLLLVNPLNDPFVPAASLPKPNEVSPAVTLHYPRHGGHVGFATGGVPGRLDWLPAMVLDYLGVK